MDADPFPGPVSTIPGVFTAARVAEAAASLFLGAACAGCGRAGPSPCALCRREVASTVPRAPWVDVGVPVVAAGEYAGVLRALLLSAKEHSSLGTVPLLGQRLAVAVAVLCAAAGTDGPLVLVPIPSPPGRVAERGLDFTGSLARAAARRLRGAGVPTGVCAELGLRRRPDDQAGLDRAARRRNLTGALVAAGRLPVGTVIVVDDIVTTGATLAEAVRALGEAGRTPVGAATVAATTRNGGARSNRTPPLE